MLNRSNAGPSLDHLGGTGEDGRLLNGKGRTRRHLTVLAVREIGLDEKCGIDTLANHLGA